MKRITSGARLLWLKANGFQEALIDSYGKLAPLFRNSVLPYVLASVPVFVMSVTGSTLVMPLVIFMSTVLIFYIAHDMDAVIFSLTKQESRKAITIPLSMFICIWGIVMVIIGKGQIMNGVVGPYCAVLLVACAPAYRWKATRLERRIPLWISMSLAGMLAVGASLFYIDK